MYSGPLASIPVGFVFCDGNNGTPNMQDRFIVCKGPSYGHMTAGGGAVSLTTDVQGNHSHGGSTQYHALTVNEMPVHSHSVYDPGHAHGVYDPGHAHSYEKSNYVYGNIYSGGSAQWHDVGAANGGGIGVAVTASGANIQIHGAGTGQWIYNNGGGAGHLHVMSVDGGHAHNVSGNVTPWYYALAFIMKLP